MDNYQQIEMFSFYSGTGRT